MNRKSHALMKHSLAAVCVFAGVVVGVVISVVVVVIIFVAVGVWWWLRK